MHSPRIQSFISVSTDRIKILLGRINLSFFIKLKTRLSSYLEYKGLITQNTPERSISFSLYRKLAVCLLFLGIVLWTKDINTIPIPQPLILSHYEHPDISGIKYTFNNYESLYRVGKYAIGKFRAMVPNNQQIQNYVQETLALHNLKSISESRLSLGNPIPKGTTIEFFPPANIHNPRYKKDIRAFNYFMSMVDDSYAYITGVWAERGAGGSSSKHEGVDVAAKLGARIISPMDGVAWVRNINLGGRTVGIESENSLLLFCHMGKRFVKSGQKIKKGQVIGTVGMSGRTSGPHLHVSYGIRFPNGSLFGRHRYKWTDPMLWFYRQQYFSSSL
ncbi:MAG: M23 family metallopeptidase [Fibrobacteria bacterium]|nr:M23 family metallopeptidase [Fibrobacteria bacterium]